MTILGVLNMARQIALNATAEFCTEMERIQRVTGLDSGKQLQHAFSLLRMYIEAEQNSREMRIYDSITQKFHTRIVLPFPVRRE